MIRAAWTSDVTALRLRLDALTTPRRASRDITLPPMLLASWQLLLDADQQSATMIVEGSLADA